MLMQTVVRSGVLLAVSAALVACGGGGGGESSSAPAPVVTVTKEAHPGLTVSNISTEYQSAKVVEPVISGQIGSLDYELADPATDVVSIEGNRIVVRNAGSTRVRVTDSGDSKTESTTSTLELTVQKAQRTPLLVNDLFLKPDDQKALEVSGAYGTLSFEAAQSAGGCISIQDSDKVTGVFPCETSVTVRDTGGRNYLPAENTLKVKVAQPDGEFAKVTDLAAKPFVSGGLIKPVIEGDLASGSVFSFAQDAATDVVQLNATNGAMGIKHAGTTRIRLTQPGRYSGEAANVQEFSVTVNKAQNTELMLERTDWTYAPDNEVSLVAVNKKGLVSYSIEDTSQTVVQLDAGASKLRLLSAGSVTLTVRDSGDRDYAPATAEVKVNIGKAVNDQLTAKDIFHSFTSASNVCLKVDGQKGALSYAIKQDAAADVTTVNESGCLVMKKAGTTTIEITDSGNGNYQATKAEARIQINKILNETLSAEGLRFDTAQGQVLAPKITGSKGNLSYSLGTSSQEGVLAMQSDGSVKVVKAGYAIVYVADSGDDIYMPAKTNFAVNIGYADGTLMVNSVNETFAEGKIVPLTVDGAIGTLSVSLSKDSPADVATIDIDKRQVSILNSGTAYFVVTDSGDATHSERKLQVRVTVDKAPVTSPPTFDSSLVQGTYGNAYVTKPGLTGVISGSTVKYTAEPYSQDVITLNSKTGWMDIRNAGELKVTLTASHRNYLDTQASYSVRVNKKSYPGVPDMEDPKVPTVHFVPGMKVQARSVINPLGKVHYALSKDSSTSITSDGTISIPEYRDTQFTVQVYDDGGRNYEQGYTTYTMSVIPPEENSGEKAVFTLDGQPLVIRSDDEVFNHDKSYFQLFASGKVMGAEPGKDYSLMNVRLLDQDSKVKLVTLRGTRKKCGGGVQPLESLIENCSESQEVELSIHPEDGMNASLPAGHYRSQDLMALAFYAPPHGKLVGSYEREVRSWWIVKLDFDYPVK